MTEQQKIYFELFDTGGLVRLEPQALIKYNSELGWDRNWIKTNVTIRGGSFSGQNLGEIFIPVNSTNVSF